MKGYDVMPLPKKLTYTIKDIYDLPEGQRAELVDGQMYMMAPPSKIHQKLVQELSRFFEITSQKRAALVKFILPNLQYF